MLSFINHLFFFLFFNLFTHLIDLLNLISCIIILCCQYFFDSLFSLCEFSWFWFFNHLKLLFWSPSFLFSLLTLWSWRKAWWCKRSSTFQHFWRWRRFIKFGRWWLFANDLIRGRRYKRLYNLRRDIIIILRRWWFALHFTHWFNFFNNNWINRFLLLNGTHPLWSWIFCNYLFFMLKNPYFFNSLLYFNRLYNHFFNFFCFTLDLKTNFLLRSDSLIDWRCCMIKFNSFSKSKISLYFLGNSCLSNFRLFIPQMTTCDMLNSFGKECILWIWPIYLYCLKWIVVNQPLIIWNLIDYKLSIVFSYWTFYLLVLFLIWSWWKTVCRCCKIEFVIKYAVSQKILDYAIILTFLSLSNRISWS